MNTQTLFQSCLTLHIIALILMAGTTVVDYISFKTFWKLFSQGRENVMGLMEAMGKFPRLIGIGAALLIFTGIGMMALTHGVFGEQLWFRIKFGLVLVLIANGLIVGRRHGLKLRKLINDNPPDVNERLIKVKRNLQVFHLSQLGIFAIIIFLSVFKFN